LLPWHCSYVVEIILEEYAILLIKEYREFMLEASDESQSYAVLKKV
jgi:hypothetical protein